MRAVAIAGLRLLSQLLPARQRLRFAPEMVVVFAAQWNETVRSRGRLATLPLAVRAYSDVIRTALGMRLGRGGQGGPSGTGGRDHDGLLDAALQDVRYAARSLLATPGFTLAATITLALGIGVNAAVFSLVDALLFRTPPGITAPEDLVALHTLADGSAGVSSYVDFRDFEQRVEAFSSLTAYKSRDMDLTQGSETRRVRGLMVTGRYFETLGVEPALGRLLGPQDDLEPDAHPVAVLSWGLWQSGFGGARDVLGRGLDLNGRTFTLVGVAPRGFAGAALDSVPPQVFVPMMMQGHFMPGSGYLLDRRGWGGVLLVGRLAPGSTLSRAAAQVDTVGRWIRDTFPTQAGWREYSLVPQSRAALPPGLRGTAMRIGTLLASVSALVLLVACVNVANLLLARLAARRREIAVRQALGAGRSRLARQLLIEAGLLAMLGAAVGVALAAATLRTVNLLPVALPEGIGLDLRVLVFALAIAAAAACAFGVLPVLRATRGDTVDGLRNSGDLRSGGRRTTARMLVAAQVALSMVLLVAAGLLARTLVRLQSVDPGFDPSGVAVVSVDPALQGYERGDLVVLYRELQSRAAALPGVIESSLASVLPGPDADDVSTVWIEGTPGEDLPRVNVSAVGVGYFRTLRIPITRGRDFEASDVRASPVVIANAAAADWVAERYGLDLLGLGVGPEGPDGPLFEVVGVTAPSKTGSLRADPTPTFYLPYQPFMQMGMVTGMTLLARTEGDPTALAARLRSVLADVAPGVPAIDVGTFEKYLAGTLESDRALAGMVGFAALLSLLLAVVGLYGLLSYSVSRRAGELGLRLALGARPADVRAMVIRQGVTLAASGAVIGSIGALAVGRLLRSFLFGVSATDPVTYLAVGGLLVVVACGAAWLPARRATRVDPASALRAS